MMRIGILSDTHGDLPKEAYTFFKDCDELWHAGDIGAGVLEELQAFKPVVAVFGNTDGCDMRCILPETQLLRREGMKLVMTHIGGYPGRYEKRILPLLENEKPDIFIAGHSHILRIMYDKSHNLLHINPGAAGWQGFHNVRTMVRLILDGEPKNVEYIEIKK